MTCDVSLIVISLNSHAFLRECLASVRSAVWRRVSHEVIVVDNGSTDGTTDMVRREFPEVRVVANAANVGYCAAGNQGAAVAGGRHLLFLNDDIEIVDPDWLDTLLEHAPAQPLLSVCQQKGIAVVIGGPYNSGILASGAVPVYSAGAVSWRRFTLAIANAIGRFYHRA